MARRCRIKVDGVDPPYGFTTPPMEAAGGVEPTARLLRIDAAARYLSATTWFVETLIRDGRIPFRILGKRRVIEVGDLDAWIDKQKKLIAERSVHVAACRAACWRRRHLDNPS